MCGSDFTRVWTGLATFGLSESPLFQQPSLPDAPGYIPPPPAPEESTTRVYEALSDEPGSGLSGLSQFRIPPPNTLSY